MSRHACAPAGQARAPPSSSSFNTRATKTPQRATLRPRVHGQHPWIAGPASQTAVAKRVSTLLQRHVYPRRPCHERPGDLGCRANDPSAGRHDLALWDPQSPAVATSDNSPPCCSCSCAAPQPLARPRPCRECMTCPVSTQAALRCTSLTSPTPHRGSPHYRQPSTRALQLCSAAH